MDGKTDPPSSSIFIPLYRFSFLYPLFLDVAGCFKRMSEKRGKKARDNIAPSCYISLFSSHLSTSLPLCLPLPLSSAAPVKCRRGCGIERKMERQSSGWRDEIGEWGEIQNISMLRVSVLSLSPSIPIHLSISPSVFFSSLVTAIIPSKHSSLRT